MVSMPAYVMLTLHRRRDERDACVPLLGVQCSILSIQVKCVQSKMRYVPLPLALCVQGSSWRIAIGHSARPALPTKTQSTRGNSRPPAPAQSRLAPHV